ncbi:unnamed protein product [Dibothriocephalus latus]|uniref:Phosphoribosyltransferase domain-containing protein n=1 Tax=Dibothriocephalus latus TaxID=60516 RepID=A0A3P7LXI2_DIBLA|nr:unnamed protein product [Dibothriocephalus latus]
MAPNTQICGVSILRAGEAFEPSLCVVCKDVRLGKILIQTNPETMEPELHYLRLPSDIKDCYVILMDSTVASGAAAIMAIRILLEHDVPEDHIILISLIMAVQGAHSVAYAYPSICTGDSYTGRPYPMTVYVYVEEPVCDRFPHLSLLSILYKKICCYPDA